jgi:hypothetical protein
MVKVVIGDSRRMEPIHCIGVRDSAVISPGGSDKFVYDAPSSRLA